uniref:Uncharacterized protein n=1 Tax=Guillardia theta TaxID=55529 RepID=A0A7S4PRI0_GUITH|mmetsp:Transcript_9832/g.32898  ORF Transcript_9832/g.32898 Transcript_9832/m.32898 type:complete len:350 (+) Transcript_9832:178-1227(+)
MSRDCTWRFFPAFIFNLHMLAIAGNFDIQGELHWRQWMDVLEDSSPGQVVEMKYGGQEVESIFLLEQLRLRGGGACLPFPASSPTNALETQLFHAASTGNVKQIERLVKLGVAVDCTNNQQQNPILKAAERGKSRAIQALVDAGASIDSRDAKNSSALHYAAYNGHTTSIELLVKLGSDVNLPNKFGYSPLQYASSDGRLDTVKTLLTLGAQVNCQDYMNWTSLHRAAGNGHAEVALLLLHHGADVNASDVQNYTALHEAAWCGHVDVVKVLIAFGADMHRADLWGNTPLDLAYTQAMEGKSQVYEYMVSVQEGRMTVELEHVNFDKNIIDLSDVSASAAFAVVGGRQR